MSAKPTDPLKQPKQKPAQASVGVVKSGRSPSDRKKKAAASSTTPRRVRLCQGCQGKVSLSARYCRHCGEPMSNDVPANPHLPPKPKAWRPSRIPKQRPAPVSEVLPTPTPGPTEHPPAEVKTVVNPAPQPPRVWDPVPELEQRMAQLRAMHERLRPQLARADLFKRRMRLP